MRISALFLFAVALTGCEREIVINVPAPEVTVIVEDEGGADTDAVMDSGEEEPSCGPFVVYDYLMNEYEVGTDLVFSLNPSSPSGEVGHGLEKVLSVNATALCGDVTLEYISLHLMGEDRDGTGWISRIPQTISGIAYQKDGATGFAGYGYGDLYDTPEYDAELNMVHWRHDFSEPIEIEQNKTFTFDLYIVFGGTPVGESVTPGEDDVFFADLGAHAVWYGADDPAAYPEPYIVTDTVLGYDLHYRP